MIGPKTVKQTCQPPMCNASTFAYFDPKNLGNISTFFHIIRTKINIIIQTADVKTAEKHRKTIT